MRHRERGAVGTIALACAGLAAIAATPAPPHGTAPDAVRWDAPHARNPILPGYFADPSIVHDHGRWYVFATIDPWGGDHLGRWTSTNGRDWRFSKPDWPTKAAATSPESGGSMVWAPSVVHARNGRWYMYVSVGSEVWVGSAPSPAGPWRDAHGGTPLIRKSFAPQYHMIDAEAFIDDDGQAYLAWGSGLNWTNGHCFVVKLRPDMVSFDGTPQDVTPTHYFEGPFLSTAAGRYTLSYSDGNTTKDTYQVRAAIGPSPFGPFSETPDSPLLATDAARSVVSPGHHALFRSGGRAYILYHRQALPWTPGRAETLRQISVDPLAWRGDGTPRRVTPSHGSDVAGFAPHRAAGLVWRAGGSGAGDPLHGPARAADDNYATLWKPAGGGAARLVADLGRVRRVASSALRPEYPDRPVTFAIEASRDGRRWTVVQPPRARQGSPIETRLGLSARYLRLVFPKGGAALWEWTLR